jgi:GrpB-like predicted nucleotidyltransferase (UPF0157 family)
MVMFWDRLRIDATDRELYAGTKLDLARQEWRHVQNYAYAKTTIIEDILARARRSTQA